MHAYIRVNDCFRKPKLVVWYLECAKSLQNSIYTSCISHHGGCTPLCSIYHHFPAYMCVHLNDYIWNLIFPLSSLEFPLFFSVNLRLILYVEYLSSYHYTWNLIFPLSSLELPFYVSVNLLLILYVECLFGPPVFGFFASTWFFTF